VEIAATKPTAPRADDEPQLAFIASKSVQLASLTLLSHWLRVTSPWQFAERNNNHRRLLNTEE
jgi:hypothetical protein